MRMDEICFKREKHNTSSFPFLNATIKKTYCCFFFLFQPGDSICSSVTVLLILGISKVYLSRRLSNNPYPKRPYTSNAF